MSPRQAVRPWHKLDLGAGRGDPRTVARVLERNCYLRDFFLEPLPERGAVIDVGAQVGCFSVLALELLEPELLVAFEPDRANLELLVKNLAAIETSSRVETALTAPWSSAARFPTAALDGQLGQLGVGEAAVRILRIRAEGAENEILEGGRECLQRTSGVVGEVRHGVTRIERFRELLAGFVVAIGAPTPPTGLRPFWAVREELVPAERRRHFVERAEVAALRESLWQLAEDRLLATGEPGSGGAVHPESVQAIERQLRLDRDVIEWQKGSLVRLRRDHDDGLRRSAEMNAELHRSLASLDERLADLGRHLETVEGSVQQAAELARELAREADGALRRSAVQLEERLAVLGRRLNTLQESAGRAPDLAQPLLSSKPWRIYLWLGRTKRAVARRLAPLTGRHAPRQAGLDAAPAWHRPQRARVATPHRVLWIDRRLPTPDRDAASLRVSHLVSVLQEARFDVSLLPLDLQAPEPYAADLRERGVEVIAAPDVASADAHLESHGTGYDLVVVSRADAAADWLDRVRACCPRARIVLDTVALASLRETRLAELEDSDSLREAAARRRQEELSAARRADLTLVVSQAEKNQLGRDAPELAVHVLSTVHPRQQGGAFAARRDLLFLADFGQPHNADAALWLAEEILPAIRARLPDVRLHLVGCDPNARLRALAGEAIPVTGFVPDLERYIDGCRVALAPLRYGAGVMAKTTQAMAHGLPSVTTAVGAEGIGLVHGVDAMIADAPEEFADCVARLYRDEELWLRLSRRGLERAREEFSAAAARRSLAAMLQAIGHPWALERRLRLAEFGSPD